MKSNTRSSWRTVKLGELCARIDYGFTASADFSTQEPRFLRITDIQNGRVEWDSVPGCKISDAETEQNRLSDGDIVFARTGATTGKSFLIKSPPKAVFASYLIRMRLKEECDPEFFSLFLQGEDYWRQIRSQARGGAQPNFNASMLSALQVKLPDLPEQRRLAARLREQMAAVERARAAVQAQLDAAQTLPAALLRAVFETGKWKWLPVDELAETCSGTTPSRGRQDFYGGKIPWVKTGELVDGVIHDTEEHITETALRETSLRLLPKNTLLIAMYGQGQTRGRTALLACEATTNQACFAILPNEKFDPKFLQLWFRHSYARLRQASEGRGGNQSNFNGKVLGAEEVPLPPLAEQQEIAARLDAELTAARALVETLETRLAEIELLPATLLRAAFTGH